MPYTAAPVVGTQSLCIWGHRSCSRIALLLELANSTHPAKIPLCCTAIILCGLRLAGRPQDGNALGGCLVGRSKHDKKRPVSTYMYIHAYMYYTQMFPVTLQSTAVRTFQSNWVVQTVYGVCCSLATLHLSIPCLHR